MIEHLPPALRRLGTAAVVVAVALTISGCSARGAKPPPPIPTPTNVDLSQVDIESEGPNGVWLLSGADALDQVVAATKHARWFRMSGAIDELVPVEGGGAGTPGRHIDLTVSGAPSSYRADIVAGIQSVSIVVVDGSAYVQGNAAYAERRGVPELAQGFVCTAVDDPLVAEWKPLLTPSAILTTVTAGADLTVLDPATDDAQTTQLVIGSGGAPVGQIAISAIHAPLPANLVIADLSGEIDVAFSGWGEEQQIVAPDQISIPCD